MQVLRENKSLISNQRDVLAKGPKYPEPKSINWKHNFKILMDSTDAVGRM
jgi:hypothetical protein